jgi:hypothetical protein
MDFAGKPAFGFAFLAICVSSLRWIVIPLSGGDWLGGDAMSKPRDERQKDLFRPALEQIIDMGQLISLESTA